MILSKLEQIRREGVFLCLKYILENDMSNHSRKKGAKKHTETHWIEFLRRIGEGRSANDICKNDSDMPAWRVVSEKLNRDADFASRYAMAMENRGQVYADKIAEIIDKVIEGKIDPNAGRVAIDGLKWTSSKLAPRKYGDVHRMEVKHETTYVDALKQISNEVEGVQIQATDDLRAREEKATIQ